MVGLAAQRDAVSILCWAGVSERRACELVGAPRATIRYVSRKHADEEIRTRLEELAAERRRFGYRRLHQGLQKEGFKVNHKKVYRLYCQMHLQVRRKRRKQRTFRGNAFIVPEAPNERWSMDFMSDSMACGRKFRTLNVIDDCTRECLAIEVGTSLPGLRVARVLDRLIAFRGKPNGIVCDNGPEFTSVVMKKWMDTHGIPLLFIEPGRPMQNALVESFNGKMRDECLNENLFFDVPHARQIIEDYRQDFNTARPHSGLGGLTPAQKHANHMSFKLAV